MIGADPALRERVAAFYAYETMLLDENRLREWLDLFDESVRYVMPMRETRLGSPDANPNPPFYLFNDDKESLVTRVARLETGMALVESPTSATQRLVTDILLLEGDDESVTVRSSFLCLQVRDEQNETTFAGHRTDRLAITGDAFRVRRRDILLAHYVLPRTIGIFF
jgi:3-phenylpropionate/cinnamic acid dioxygenase small subunit